MNYRFEYRVRKIGSLWYAERRRGFGWPWKKVYTNCYYSRQGAEKACESHASFCRRCRNGRSNFKIINLGWL